MYQLRRNLKIGQSLHSIVRSKGPIRSSAQGELTLRQKLQFTFDWRSEVDHFRG